MNKEEWKKFEASLQHPFAGGADLKADGHDLQIRVTPLKNLRYTISVYVDGYIKGEYMRPGSAIGAKFYRAEKVCFYGRAAQAKLMKECGKRFAKKEIADATRIIYASNWNTATALRRHLTKTCSSIELVRAGYPVKSA